MGFIPSPGLLRIALETRKGSGVDSSTFKIDLRAR
jgi:hypothetical protein